MATIWQMKQKKKALMDILDTGMLPVMAWEETIQEMKDNGYLAMAGDLQKRLDHYKSIWLGITDEPINKKDS